MATPVNRMSGVATFLTLPVGKQFKNEATMVIINTIINGVKNQMLGGSAQGGLWSKCLAL